MDVKIANRGSEPMTPEEFKNKMKQRIPILPQNLKTIEHNGDSLNDYAYKDADHVGVPR